MKTRILSTLAILSLIFATNLLTACDDDDDDSGSSVYNAEATVLTTTDGDKLLVTKCGSYSYEYDDEGYLTYVSDSYYGSFDVDWDPFTFEDNKSTVSFTTNSNGFVTKSVYSYSGSDESREETTTYSYDSSGHLTKLSFSGKWEEEDDDETISESESGTITLTWSSGNLTKMVWTESYTDEDGTEKETSTYNYNYDDAYENVTKQYVPTMIIYWGEEPSLGGIFDSAMLAYIGLLGVGPEELPVSVSIEKDDGDTDYECSYRLNSDGSVYYWKATDGGDNSGYIYYDDYPEDAEE